MATRTVGSGKDYSTIAAALSAANADDIISIDAGTYTEYHLDVYDDGLTIKAATPTTGGPTENTVIMDGEGSTSKEYAFYSFASGCIYQHITFKNYEEYAIRRGTLDGASLTLSGCLIYGCDGPAISHLGYNASTPAEIYDSMIIVDEGRALNIGGNSTVIIKNSVLAVNAEDEAVIVSSVSYPNITASHCTFIGRGWNGSDGRHYHLVNQVAKVDNCIVYGGNGNGIGSHTHNNNLVYLTHTDSEPYVEWAADSYDGTAVSAGSGDITGDPKFVTAPTHGSITPFNMDLNLQASSPAVNAGSSAVTTDISGSARDSSPDIGAYEYISAASAWSDYGSYSDPRFLNTGDVVAGSVMSQDYQLKAPASPGVDQAPRVLNTYGIIFRNRTKPYAASHGGDPDNYFSGTIGE